MVSTRARALRAACSQPVSLEQLENRQLLAAVYWDGGPSGTGTDWHDPENWSADVVPGADDDAILSVAADPTVTITQNVAVRSIMSDEAISLSGILDVLDDSEFNAPFSFAGVELRGTGQLILNAGMDWSAGFMSGAGHVVIPAGQTLTRVNGAGVCSKPIDNSGTFDWMGGNFDLGSVSFHNMPGSVFNHNSAGALSLSDSALLVNEGIYNKNAAGVQVIQAFSANDQFQNAASGVFNINAGTASMGCRVMNDGVIDIDAGAVLQLNTYAFYGAGSSIVGAGFVDFTGGVHTFTTELQNTGGFGIRGSAIVELNTDRVLDFRLQFAGGELGGTGQLTFDAGMDWSAGFMSGTGHVVIPAGRTLARVNGAGVCSKPIDNSGTFDWMGGNFDLGSVSFHNMPGSVFNHNSSGTLSLSGDALFMNEGIYNKNAAGVQVIQAFSANDQFQNGESGLLNINAGTAALSCRITNDGLIDVDAGAVLQLNTYALYGAGSSIVGAGFVDFTGGVHTFTTELQNIGGFGIRGSAIVQFNSDRVFDFRLQLAGGELGGTGQLTFNAGMDWSAGFMSGAGHVVVPAGRTLTRVNGAGVCYKPIDNSGTFNWTGGNLSVGAVNFHNMPGGVFSDNSTGSLSLSGDALFINEGIYSKNAVGAQVFEAGSANDQFQNAASGIFNINAGTASMGCRITNDGLIDVDAGAVLQLNTYAFYGAGSSIVGAGVVSFVGGVHAFTTQLRNTGGFTIAGSMVEFNAPFSIDQPLLLNSGTLSGTGNITLVRGMTWSGGSMSGTGTTTIPASRTLTVSPGGAPTLARTLVNEGTLSFSAGSNLSVQTFVNNGLIQLPSGTATVSGSIIFDGACVLEIGPTGTLVMQEDLLGATSNADTWNTQGILRFAGGGTRRLEVMSRDRGNTAVGFAGGFLYSRIELAPGTNLNLVDEADNSPGIGLEALYVNTLVVPAGSTLDLGGRSLYARSTMIEGTIVGGTINEIADGGPLAFGAPAAGNIANVGEEDLWTFFGRAGREVSLIVNTGPSANPAPIQPSIGFARVEVLAADDTVIASADNISSGSGTPVVLAGVPISSDGTYRIRISAPASQPEAIGRYVLAAYDDPADTRVLSLNQFVVGVIENPFAIDRWTFSASANQQVRLDISAAGSPTIAFSLVGPNGFVGFLDITGESALVNLPDSGEYSLVVRNTGGAGEPARAYCCRLEQTAQTPLPLGTPLVSVLTGPGASLLYSIDLPESQSLFVDFHSPAGGASVEVYARRGAPPTRTAYFQRSADPSSGDQQLLVASAPAGTWYVLVYGANVPAPAQFSIRADAGDVQLVGSGPYSLGANDDSVLTLRGAGFIPGMSVTLIDRNDSSYTIEAQRVEIDSYSQLTATFDLTGRRQVEYDIRVTRPSSGSTDTLAGAFRIVAPGQAHLETRLVLPRALGLHQPATIYVEYANTGTAAMPAPLLLLKSADPDGSAQPIMTLDQSRIIVGLWGLQTSSTELTDGFSTSIQMLASGAVPGVLNPGEHFSVPVHYAGLLQPWLDTSVPLELRIFNADEPTPIDWEPLEEPLRPEGVSAATWDRIFSNLVAGVGGTWGSYVHMLSENAEYLGRLGQRVVDVQQLWQFEVRQAIGLTPIDTLASDVDASMQLPGSVLSFTRELSGSLLDRNEIGPLGYGWTTPWSTTARTDASGNVTIITGGASRRQFDADSRSMLGGDPLSATSFFGGPTETGTLVRDRDTGAITLRERDGNAASFSASGMLHETEDANGNRVTATYDGAGRLVRVTSTPAGGSDLAWLDFSYTPGGRISSVTDSAGRATSYVYDAAGVHLMEVTTPGGTQTFYTYATGLDGPEHALLSIQSGGTIRSFEYDTRGRLINSHLPGNAEAATFEYETNTGADGASFPGRFTATNADGGRTQFFFDDLGRLAKTVDPFGAVTTAEFGTDLRLARLIDPEGASQEFTWCGCGSLTSQTDELGNITRFSYADVGSGGTIRRMVSMTDANGNVTSYAYDSHGNLTATRYADGSLDRTDYDAAGSALSYVNRRGQAIAFERNAAGQVTRETFPDGASIEYAYDMRGRMISATDSGGTTTFQYDNADRLVRVTYPPTPNDPLTSRFLEYTYDAFGRRTRMVDNTGFAVNYEYDAAGRLSRLTDTAGQPIVSYIYDQSGRLSRKDNANGTFSEYVYDLAGQLLSLVNRAPGGGVNSRFDYAYDRRGRRTSMATIDGEWTYTYDATGQLTHGVFAPVPGSPIPAQDLEYVYDAMGNRSRTIENGVTTSYTTNNLNQYTQVGDDLLVYDADGNLISRYGPSGNATYTYDQRNRLVRVVTPEGTWEYEYSPLGKRTASIVNGERTEYLVDPQGQGDVVAEYAATGLVARSTYGLGLISRTLTGTSAFYDFDALGATAGLTDVAGAVLNQYAYGPFGDTIQSIGALPNQFMFVGQFGVTHEGNGLEFMRARSYSPSEGRFITPDPIGFGGNDPNLYRYALNTPALLIDPAGTVYFDNTISFALPWGPSASFGVQFGSTLCVTLGGGVGIGGSGLGGSAGFAPGDPSPGSSFNGNISFGVFSTGFSLDDTGSLNWSGGSVGGDEGTGWNFGAGLSATRTWCLPPPGSHPPTPPGGNAGASGSAPTVFSGDPNHLLGPAGYGDQNYLRADSTLPYRIEFENYGPGSLNDDGTPAPPERWATAPAQLVTITNQLSPFLDLSTFRLGSLGFGDTFITIPAGYQQFQTIIDVVINDRAFQVWIDAGIDFASRTVFARFQSIDPLTNLPPDVLTGFLLPEDGGGHGKGFFSYTISPITGLATGTQIRNIALISFDNQLSIATNQVDPLIPELGTDPAKEALVTIDVGAPSSAVEPLAPSQATSTFLVRWAGTDDTQGSGIRAFTIYVSEDGGPATAWLENTALTEATYWGQFGHSYRFYSVATDNVGNAEAAPGPDEFDAITTTGLPGVIYFDNDSGDNSWDNPVNWSGDAVPLDGADVVISLDGVSVTITYSGGTLSLNSLICDEALLIEGGNLTLAGFSQLNAGVTLTGGTLILLSSVEVTGTLSNSGVLDLRSGAALSIYGDYTQTPAGTLRSAILSTNTFGRLNATGVATIDGSLEVTFDDSYVEVRSDSFDIVAGASRTGAFDTILLPDTNPADTLKPILLDTPGGVRVFITSTADFNSDGVVNSQDFFDFLIDFFNSDSDFNGDGVINSQDFFDFLVVFFQG